MSMNNEAGAESAQGPQGPLGHYRQVTDAELVSTRANHPIITEGISDDMLRQALGALPEQFEADGLRISIQTNLDIEAEVELSKIDLPEQNNLRHMLKMANLPIRDWKILSGLVIIPDDDNFKEEMKRIAQIFQYRKN